MRIIVYSHVRFDVLERHIVAFLVCVANHGPRTCASAENGIGAVGNHSRRCAKSAKRVNQFEIILN